MSDGLNEKVALLIFCIDPYQRALDVARPRIMPLDQVAVVGVHYADGACQTFRRPRMKLLPQSFAFGGDLRQEVREVAIGRIDACRLDRIWRLLVHSGRSSYIKNRLHI